MEKKRVCVTGATSGIGLATVEYLLESENYEVIGVGRRKEKIQEVQEKLKEKGKEVTFFLADMNKEEECNQLVKNIQEKYDSLDGLVNCAGIIREGGIEETTLEEWNEILTVNLTSMFILTKGLIPLLKKGKNASIVNVSSISSQRVGFSIAYCTSKAGVDMFTKYLGQELGKYNIRVNSVNPAVVYTNIYITNGVYTQEEYDKIIKEKNKRYPIGRIGDAKKDIAPTIEFLLSDKSLWTTGSIYIIDGGKSV